MCVSMWNRSPFAGWGRASAAFAILALAWCGPAGASDQEGCLLCHRLALRVVENGVEKNLKVQDPPGSSHDPLFCSDCHKDARDVPHAAPPGIAQCIGECHGGGEGAAATHRSAAFGGLAESHRRAVPGRSPCVLCHRAVDRKGDRAAPQRRCAACHREERSVAAAGPHGGRASEASFCTDCHPPHDAGKGQGAGGNASCAGPQCHAGSSREMRPLGDHRGQGGTGRGTAKGILFFLLASAGWAAGAFLSPRPAKKGERP